MALAELMTVKKLRELAVGMPYRSEATKVELIAWLRKYRPETLTEVSDGATADGRGEGPGAG